MDFKIPSAIPQDLQLIHDIVGEIPSTPPRTTTKSPSPAPVETNSIDSIGSTDDSDTDSEREVEADILAGLDEEDEEGTPVVTTPIDSPGDSESESESDSDLDVEDAPSSAALHTKPEDLTMDDDEEGGSGAAVAPDQVRTKNEVVDLNIVIPEVEEVEEHEVLEKVGEVMSIIEKVVIVRGTPSQVHNRASDRTLDSDTLLVFEDRKVLGYIWETFGPTNQPFYRVQFNDSYPLDAEKVRVSREVFHIPQRSNFVFVSQLKRLKGSDASNAHDEEPGDDELEFSDDEAERDYKRALKEKRGGFETASRHSTPVPSHPRDQEMSDDLYGTSPYDSSLNDMDFGAGPSRPAPVPYDDPYSDSYGLTDQQVSPSVAAPPVRREAESSGSHISDRPRGRGRGKSFSRDGGGRERGRGRGQDRRRGGDRGRGRGRGRGSGGASGSDRWGPDHAQQRGGPTDDYDPRISRPLSPTSLAIARATGQLSDGSTFGTTQPSAGTSPTTASPVENDWSYQQYSNQYDYNFGYQQPYVQPHINPRFASAFGMNFGFQPQAQYGSYGQYNTTYNNPGGSGTSTAGQWTDEWNTQNGQSAPNQGGDIVPREEPRP